MPDKNIDVTRATVRWDETDACYCNKCGSPTFGPGYTNLRYYYNFPEEGEPTTSSPEPITLDELLSAFMIYVSENERVRLFEFDGFDLPDDYYENPAYSDEDC